VSGLKVDRFFRAWGAPIVIGLAWAFSLAGHFLGGIEALRTGRLWLLLLLLALTIGHAFRLFNGLRRFPWRTWRRWLGAGALLGVSAAAVLIWVPTPPYTMPHQLEIRVTGEKNPQSAGRAVEILAIRREDTLTGKYEVEGDWEHNGPVWYTPGNAPAVLRLNASFAGGVRITLRTTAQSGQMTLVWDENQQVVDLYDASGGERVIDLPAIPPWQKRTWNWKMATLALIASDSVSLWVFLLAVYAFVLERLAGLRRGLRLLYPLGLLACILVNLSGWAPGETIFTALRFTPLTDRSLFTLLENNQDNNRVFAYLMEHYAGFRLRIPAGLQQELHLWDDLLRHWSRLAAVEIVEYPTELQPAEAEALLRRPHQRVELSGGLNFRYHFFPPGNDDARLLCVRRLGEDIFLGPQTTIPGCEGQP